MRVRAKSFDEHIPAPPPDAAMTADHAPATDTRDHGHHDDDDDDDDGGVSLHGNCAEEEGCEQWAARDANQEEDAEGEEEEEEQDVRDSEESNK